MSESWTLTFAGPSFVCTLYSHDGLSERTTIAEVKGLLKTKHSLPEWMASLSYNGQSLDGQGGKTVTEVGVVNGSRLEVTLFEAESTACPEHPECTIQDVCLDCQRFLCLKCSRNHLLDGSQHKHLLCICPPIGCSDWSDQQKETFYAALKPQFDDAACEAAEVRHRLNQQKLEKIEAILAALEEQRQFLAEQQVFLANTVQVSQHWKSESLPYLMEQLRQFAKQGAGLLATPEAASKACTGCGTGTMTSDLSSILVNQFVVQLCSSCFEILSTSEGIGTERQQRLSTVISSCLHRAAQEGESIEKLVGTALHLEGLLHPDLGFLQATLAIEGGGRILNEVRWIRAGPEWTEPVTQAAIDVLRSCLNCTGLAVTWKLSPRSVRHILSQGVVNRKARCGMGWEWIDLCGEGMTALTIRELGALEWLRSITMRGSGVNDAVVSELATIRGLLAVNLIGCEEVTEVGAHQLTKISSLTQVTLSGCSKILEEGFVELLHLPGLATLEVAGCMQITDAFGGSLAGLRGLRALNLRECRRITAESVSKFASLRWLESLILRGCDNLTDVTAKALLECRHLSTINVAGCTGLTDAWAIDIATLPQLTSVNFGGCVTFSDATAIALSKNLRLVSLNLFGCHQIGVCGVEKLATLPYVRFLNLGESDGVTDISAAAISEMPNLTSLDLSWCRKLTDESLRAISKSPKVASLNLSGCAITDVGARELVKLSGLTALDLGGCNQLTDSAVTEVANRPGLRSLSLFACDSVTETCAQAIADIPGLDFTPP